MYIYVYSLKLLSFNSFICCFYIWLGWVCIACGGLCLSCDRMLLQYQSTGFSAWSHAPCLEPGSRAEASVAALGRHHAQLPGSKPGAATLHSLVKRAQIFPDQGLNLCLLPGRWPLYCWATRETLYKLLNEKLRSNSFTHLRNWLKITVSICKDEKKQKRRI